MSHLFRQAMQKLSYPTMIVTAGIQKGTKPVDFHGLTISSMTSLSINPKPLIQFNIKTPSSTSTDIKRNRLFAIHFLEPTSNNIDLARHFSRGTKDILTNPFSTLVADKDYMLYSNDELGPKDVVIPLLNKTGKILICNSKNIFTVQDHEIWVGEVLKILAEPEEGILQSEHGGLLHCMSRFFKLGDLI